MKEHDRSIGWPPLEVTSPNGERFGLICDDLCQWSAIKIRSDEDLVNNPQEGTVKCLGINKWFSSPKQVLACLSATGSLPSSGYRMTRTSWSAVSYFDDRYLEHLTDDQLRDRYHDLVMLLFKTTPNGKISPVIGENLPTQWWGLSDLTDKFIAVGEEYRFRHPGRLHPADVHKSLGRFPKGGPFNKELVAKLLALLDKAPQDAIIRFGEKRYIKEFFFHGKVFMNAASRQAEQTDGARRDDETRLTLDTKGSDKTVSCGNFWMFCASKKPKDLELLGQMFRDFNADSCVVINQGDRFLDDLSNFCGRWVRTRRGWGQVNYIDPVLLDVYAGDARENNPHNVLQPIGITPDMIPAIKHFRFSYQNEVRAFCVPWWNTLNMDLDPLIIHFGDITRYDAVYLE